MSEEEIMDFEELQLPPLSGQAFHAAYVKTLAAGRSVLVSDNGSLYEIFADGRREFLKSIEKPKRIAVGTRIKLR